MFGAVVRREQMVELGLGRKLVRTPRRDEYLLALQLATGPMPAVRNGKGRLLIYYY